MALVLVAALVAGAQPSYRWDERFAQIHSEYLKDEVECRELLAIYSWERGYTQYRLCRELAFETFIAKGRQIK